MPQDHIGEQLPFGIGERELLRPVGKDAYAMRASIDEEIDDPSLAVRDQFPILAERRGDDREDPAQDAHADTSIVWRARSNSVRMIS